LLALAAVIEDPDSYQVRLPDLTPRIPFSIVDTGSQIDLAIAAEHLELDLETLYHWNPALNQWATPPNGPHRLLVPGSGAAAFQARIATIPADARVNWTRVKVANGDTLSHIAHRFDTDVASLRKANNLRGNTIRVGQGLYIPRSSRALDTYPPSRNRRDATYIVRQGDSLWTIGQAHDISVTKLMRANQVGPKDVLRVGQRLRVPNASAKVIRTVNYGVRPGDSLAKIAARFNVQINDIASWNQLNVQNYLRPGQSLKLYVDVAAGD
jgi:membrane-bound lytic murein transglycosylase D